jgi:hypothetical protein
MTQTENLELPAYEFGVRLDISSPHPKSRLQALCAALRQRWECSLARIMLGELYRFPLRILTILRTSETLPGEVRLPHGPQYQNLETLYPVSSFLLACSRGIQRLQTANPWSGPLEAQIAAQAFQLGARWGVNNGTEKRNAGVP